LLAEVWFEGRDERAKLVVKGRNLHAKNGEPMVSSVEVVTEPVKR